MKTERERWLMLIVPAALVLLLYSFIWHVPQVRDLRAKEQQLTKSRKTAVTRTRVAELQAQLRDVEKLNAQFQDELGAPMDQSSRNVVASGSVLPVNEATIELSRLMVEQRLLIEDAGIVSGADADRLLPVGWKALIERRKTDPKFRVPVLYRLRFVGQYASVTRLLTLLGERHTALPLQLEMEDAQPDTDWRRWTLLVGL